MYMNGSVRPPSKTKRLRSSSRKFWTASPFLRLTTKKSGAIGGNFSHFSLTARKNAEFGEWTTSCSVHSLKSELPSSVKPKYLGRNFSQNRTVGEVLHWARRAMSRSAAIFPSLVAFC